MQQALHRSSLVPRGFVVESAYYEGDKAVIEILASGSVGLCPLCGTVSRRVHSRYRRRVTDLPLSGRIVQLLVVARRFRCDAVLCRRQIFTERFAEECWRHQRDARRGWTPLSITSVWRLADGRRQASQNG
jgi:transposase